MYVAESPQVPKFILNFQAFTRNILSRAMAAQQKECNQTRLRRKPPVPSWQLTAEKTAAQPAAL
jgi:hypothetical protein